MAGSGLMGGAWPVVATAPLVLLGSYGIAWLTTRIGVAIASRRLRHSDGLDWVERARRAWPARRVVGIDLALVPTALGAIIATHFAPWLGMARMPWAVLGGLAGMVAILVEGQALERRLCRSADPGVPRPSGISLSIVLLLPLLLPFGLMVAFLPGRWGWNTAAILAAGAASTLFQVGGGWLMVLRRVGLARPASDRLSAIVERTAARVGVRPRSVIELDSPNANALAWPVPRLVVFTRPALQILDDDELAAITAHELGHLNESWEMYLVRIFTSFFLVACASAGPLTSSFGVLVGLAPTATLLAFVLVAQRLGRRMEERSDRLAKEHEGESAGTYARALEAIHRANLIPAVMAGKRQVHPNLYDRLIAAGATPDYPRPGPPLRVGLASLPTWLLVATALWLVLKHLPPGTF